MAIITYSHLRAGTVGWPDITIPGSSSAAVTDANLTSAITAAETLLNSICDTQFVGDASNVALILDGPPADRLGTGRTRLILPKMVQFDSTNKCAVISTIEERDDAGTWTTVDSTTYRTQSSEPNPLNVSTEDMVTLLSGTWTTRPQAIRITGKFGFATTPEWAKRAVALIVYDWWGGQNTNLHRAVQWTQGDSTYLRAQEIAFGMPELEDFINRYRFRSDSIAAV